MSEALGRLLATAPSLGALSIPLVRAARSEAPILVLGEAGTGRSALARALHAASRRAEAPLVEVDAGAIPVTLFESELFGHRPGAFTGADRAQAGRVERAEGGTLVLDHVEELPVPVQPKLLRLLAERVYAPLGGGERPADVRFVAVGPDDLPSRVERGTFRDDLYFRLEVLTFRLPPLRDRPDDVLPLAEALLADLGPRFGRPAPRLGQGARRWMPRHAWPGNLRELRNVLERTLLDSAGSAEIDPAPPASGGVRGVRSLAECEADAIRAALAATRGHQGRAAELLGVSRKGLWEKRKRHGIP